MMRRVTTTTYCWNWNWNWKGSVAPFAAMVVLEFTDVGISTISKAAMTRGMSNYIFVVYYNALGTLILLPYFIFCRNKRAPLTFSLLCAFFLLAVIGSVGLMFTYTGIKYSSPTLSSAIANLIPVFTFLLAVIFRMESLHLRRSSSQAKCLGAIVAVSGALMVTLYKGPSIYMASIPSSNFSLELLSLSSNWVYGGFLSALGYFLGAVWYVVQAAIVKEYPEKMTIVFFYCFFVTIQCAIFTLIVERNPHAWLLTSGIEMLAISSSAIFGSVFRCGIVSWCLQKKGPFYVSMFKPLMIVIAVVMGVTFLKDTLHLGSVIGAIIIVLGIYTVMWGQSKGMDNGVCSVKLSTQKTPLLQEQI